ncbi:MAG: hypothetical protein FGM24_09880 [Candidatus Kapabacteria bacterium]|nr:hypothetical protein [Candidatus Kapabacteria bacterium]
MTPNSPFSVANHFRYSAFGTIETSGGSAVVTVRIDPQMGFYVRRHRISAWYLASGTSRRVYDELNTSDLLLVDIKTAAGKQTQNPIDIHAFNDECNDRNYPGYAIAKGAVVDYTISHEITTGANFGVPIKVRVSLFGYHMTEQR